MSYQVTARKWRPKNFEEFVGQTHIIQTLKNAITLRKISQSYLFSGPRGVGKTTLARILAKSLNCKNGPTITPCEECESCLSISQDSSLEYKEIDGASNRGIDQIREINESLKYVTNQEKYRIIVIDEVHMLTKEAFNALLKNLEEPPEKVIFIFCTTEIQKIPQTIKSRCQHYEFRPFNINEITFQLKKILDHDQISYDDHAIFLIAKNGGGSMRDSQSTLDLIIAYCQDKINVEDVQEVLGLNHFEIYIDFLTSLFKQDINTNHQFINQYLDNGKSITHFFYDLIDHINHIIFIKNGITNHEKLQIQKQNFDALVHLSSLINLDDLFLINEIIFSLLEELKITLHEKITLEYFLIKLHRYPSLIKPEYLKDQLKKILSKEKVIDKTINNPTQTSPKNIKENTNHDINLFLRNLEKKINCHIVGFDKPYLTIAGDLNKSIQDKIIKKIKQDYLFDVRLNVIDLNKKEMTHLHKAFMEFDAHL